MQYRTSLMALGMSFLDDNLWYFIIFASYIDCEYLLEQPRCGGSYEYPQPNFMIQYK